MATIAAIGVHIGDNVQTRLLPQQARMGIGRIGEFFQRPFHPPFGHGFAGMLAGIKPDVNIALAHFQTINRAAFQAIAQCAQSDAGLAGRFGHQIIMALQIIGRKIREPSNVAMQLVANGECAAILIIGRVRPAPKFAIFANDSLIIWPATGIGGFL